MTTPTAADPKPGEYYRVTHDGTPWLFRVDDISDYVVRVCRFAGDAADGDRGILIEVPIETWREQMHDAVREDKT